MTVPMCEGCKKVEDEKCTVYADPSVLMWHRNNQHCPFNPPKAESKKKRVRLGQQKSKSMR